MKKSLLFLTASLLLAGGYKVPEQSLSGIALSSANVANAHGADSAYYNPANMVFNNENKNYFEFNSFFIHLNKEIKMEKSIIQENKILLFLFFILFQKIMIHINLAYLLLIRQVY